MLIEEEQGRRVAQDLGLQFSGIAGQILKAQRLSLISGSEAQEKFTELLRTGHLGKRLYRESPLFLRGVRGDQNLEELVEKTCVQTVALFLGAGYFR